MQLLKNAEAHWRLLFSAAGWLTSIIFGFWTLPLPDSALGADAYLRFAKLMVGTVVAAFIPMTIVWKQRQHTRNWALADAALIIFAAAFILTYEYTRTIWIVEPPLCGDQRFVIGSDADLLEDARAYRANHRECQSDCLVKNAMCNPAMVWRLDSIARHSLILHALYLGGIPVFACVILCSAQVLACIVPVRRKTSGRGRRSTIRAGT